MVVPTNHEVDVDWESRHKKKRARSQTGPTRRSKPLGARCDAVRPNETIAGILPQQRVVTAHWLNLCIRKDQLVDIEDGWFEKQNDFNASPKLRGQVLARHEERFAFTMDLVKSFNWRGGKMNEFYDHCDEQSRLQVSNTFHLPLAENGFADTAFQG